MSGELNLTYSEHFAPRADGRYVCTMAAHMAMLRDRMPELALPRDLLPANLSPITPTTLPLTMRIAIKWVCR